MPRVDERSWTQPAHRKPVVLATAIALLSTLLAVVTPPVVARAAGTLLFQNNFDNRTVDGTGTVTKPTPTSGTNAACLTASGNSSVLPLLSCSGASDLQGNGKLRLTNATGNQIGGVFGATSFPSSNGLDVTFKTYQWGGNSADGMSFVLSAVDPANPVPPTVIGPGGGSLGYSPAGSINGLPNAYLGVGLDVFGNYSSTGFQGSGCTNQTNITTAVPGAVVVRGPGNARAGYCGLTTTYNGQTSSRVSLRAATRTASLVPVQVLINPTSAPYTSDDTGVVVNAGTYKVVVTPVGGTARTLTGSLPSAPSTLYPSTTWTNANGVPRQLAFGFIGSTGGSTDNHEIDDVRVLTFNPVPQLAVSTTSYVAANPALGAPVNYVVTPSVRVGADVASPISVTQTTPAGVTPVGAFGTGWSCAAPVGRSITCTTTGSSFADGTTLPIINVVGIVTASGLTATTVQNASTTTVSSTDGNPATATSTTAGTVPAAPTGVGISPTIGSVSGGGSATVTATSGTSPTAIEIGTTAEQQAGTPVVLLPCQGSATTGCFIINGSNLTIPSMPARSSAAPVTVTVVTLGVASTATYTYADKPATIATPTATAAITSSTLTWVAPDTNGSPITSYIVTPYLNGTAQTPVTFDASTTTRTFTGLVAGGSYRYTVQAVNAYGTSTASPQSVAVTPYNLPAAPVISAVTAGTQQATLTWNTPANNGSAVTGYVVTPYIGSVAQTPRTFDSTATTQTITGLTAGTAYTFTVAAQNAAGTGPASVRSTAVTPNASPTLTFAAPPAGEVGAAYSTQLTVNNGTSPFVWSISSGSLPAGLNLSSSGLLSGTPTASGSFPVTVQVVDASGQSATKAVTLVIAAAPSVTFTPAAGEVTVPYSQQPTLTGGTGPFVWAITAGSLPAGLTIDPATGLVSGTPTASGSFSVTVSVTDGFNQVANRTVSIVIAALPTITSNAPPAGQVGLAYSTTFTVAGGTAPLVWSVSAGSVPPGLSLNSSTGVLSGTPTTTGVSSFTVLVTDAFGKTTTKAVSLVVNAGPIVITKTADKSSVAPGDTVVYTIAVANTGSTAFTGVNLSDPLSGVLDDAVYSGGASATTGSLTYTNSTLGWTGNVAAGATVTITYPVVVNNPDVGNKVLANTVTSSTVGTNCPSGNSDVRCTSTVTVSGLSIVHTPNGSTTTPGSTVTFSIVVTNTGQTPYAGATLTENLSGMLDDAAYLGATATSGSVSYANPTLSWTGNLAVGASTTITYSLAVANPDPGNKSLVGTVVSPVAGSSCPSGNPAASCTATVAVLVPALSITNTAGSSTTTPGSVVPYTVTLSNTGQTAYTGTSVAIALAGALDDATYNGNAAASAGAVAFDAATSNLVWTGNLAVGATVTITASVTVRDPDPGNRVLTTVASSSAPGSTCPVGSSSSTCTSNVQVLVPALTIAKSSSVTSTTPGSVVGYTVTVTNSGQTPYTGAAFSDDLAGVADDAVFNADAAATAGTVAYNGGKVTWNGNLAVGATATITYTVTVNNPDLGDRSLTNRVTSSTPGNNCATGSGDVRCLSTVPVLLPQLSISAVSDAATTTPGSVVRFTVTVTNTGQTSYSGTALTLLTAGILDDAVGNGDRAVTTGDLAPVGSDQNSSWTLSLAPGQSGTLSGTFTVRSPATGDRLLALRIVSNAPGSTCPTGSPNSACAVAVPVLIPGLTITKTADRATVVTGGTVVYTISVTNTGETTYAGAGFTDSLANVLSDAVYSGDATASAGTVSYADSTLSWAGALAPGASATVTYSVVVRDPDPGDKRMTNTVVSTTAGSNCATTSTDARCTAVVNVLVPGLTIEKSADVATTLPGGTVQFTLRVTNSGTTVQTGAVVTDSLTGVLDDATYGGNATTTAGSVSYTAPTLTWTGTLAVGASATITYSASVKVAPGGDNRLVNVVGSTTRGNNCATGSVDPRCRVDVPVARLVIAQSYSDPLPTPGTLVTATTTLTNTGQVAYTGISASLSAADIGDDANPSGGQQASSGTLSVNGVNITWSGDIAVGAVVTITTSFTVKDPDPGNKVITATWVSNAAGSNCATGSDDSRCTALANVVVPRLTVTTAASVTTAAPGTPVTFTTTLTNSGQTAYVGASVTDSLAQVLDDSVYSGGATASSGVVSVTGSTLTWTGNLSIGATVTIAYTVVVRDPDPGDRFMSNAVTSSEVGSSCPPSGAGTGCSAGVTVLTPALTIVKSADLTEATLGSTLTYTVVVANTGQTSYPAASFTDALSGVLDDAAYLPAATSASTGATSYADEVLSWSGALAPGATATITYAVRVANPATGDRTMTNSVTSGATGNNCPVGGTDSRCAVAVAVVDTVGLTFTKTADVASTVPGAEVTYTVRVGNATRAAISGVTFTDPLGGVLDDASYNNNATATAGTVSYSAAVLSWTGTVPAQGSATVTYSVTVAAADTGDDLLTNTVASTTLPGSNNCAAASPDPRCSSTVPVARLDLVQYAAQSTATPGSSIQLTAVYTNTGQVPYNGISVSSPRADTSDDTIPTGDQTASSGTLVRTATALTWTGDIAVGQTITISRTLTVKNPDPGNQVVQATLSSAAPGNNCQTGTTDPRCSFAVTVLTPQLTLTKTANASAVVYGGTVSYTITVNNTGQTPYVGAAFTDSLVGVLDDGSYPGNAAATVGAVSYADSTLSWTGNLAVGQVATITYTVVVDRPDPGDKVMSNTVVSTDVGSNCPPASGNAACRSTVAVLTPALTIVKTADESNANLGTTVTYTVRVSNTGQTVYPAAAFSDPLTDVLDDATYNAGSTTTTSGTVSYANGVLSWSGALSPGASATITYTTTINTPSTGDRVMTNTVISSTAGNNCSAISTDSRCTAQVSVTNAFALTFEKTSGVRSAVAGQTVAYTVTATNASGSDIDGVDFTDPLGAIVDDASYNEDAVASSGTVALDGTDLTWSGTVAAGATVTVTYSVTVKTDPTGNEILAGQISSTSLPASNNCLTASTDPRCTNTVTVSSLLIQQSYAEPTTTPGSVIRLTATFTNTGQTPYEGITILSPSDGTLDDAFAVGDQTATSGTLVLSATAITWTGNIPVGGTVTVTGTLVVKDPPTGDRAITGTLVTTAPGSNCPAGGADPRCTALTTVLLPGLTLTKSASTTSVVPGGTVGYTITIANSGQSAYTAASVTDTLAGVLDDAVYNGDVVASGGSVSYTSPVLSWTGDLAVGATVTITYTVTTVDPGTGDNTLINPVASSEAGSSCPPASGNAGCVSSVDVLIPALTIEKSASAASATLGTTVTYTVLVRNSGQTTYPAATFDDSLAGVLDDATYNPAATTATSGVVSYAGGLLSWTGELAPGATATITYATTVNNPATGDRSMTSKITSTSTRSNCAANSTDVRCTADVAVVNQVSLTFEKSAGVASSVAGGVVGYTIRVANATDAPISGASFSDQLSGVLDDASYNSDAAATAGTVTYGGQVLTWTGTVPARASVTVTYSVTVAEADTGDELLTNTVASSTLPGSNNCAAASADPRCTTTVPVARLVLRQYADETTTTPGSVVHLRGIYTNTGQVPYVGISVSLPRADIADDVIATGDQTASSGTLVQTTSALTWTGDIPVGGEIILSRTSTVRDPNPGNQVITSTLSSTAPGNNCQTGTTDPRCTSTITVLTPQLSIAKTANTTVVVPNGVVGYTITVRNTGQTAYTGATVTDTLAGVLDDATYAGGATATSGTLAFSSPNLTWTGDLAVGQTATINFTVTARRPADGDKTMVNRVSSTDPGSTCLPASANPACANVVSVRTPALVTVVTASKNSALPGDLVTYTVTATNSGQTDYTTATFDAPLGGLLDDAVYGNDAAASSGTVVRTGDSLVWTGALLQGEQATITYSVTVKDPVPVAGLAGNHRLDQTISSIRNGSNCLAGSTDPRCVTSVPIASLQISNTVAGNVATAKPNDVVSYVGTFTNTGQVPYVGITVADSFVGALDNATYNGDATATSGSVIIVVGSGRIVWTGDIAVGQTVTITGSVTLKNPKAGDDALTTLITTDTPGSNCPVGNTAAECRTSVAVLTPALTITKAASVTTITPGGTVDYTITATNTGQTPYTAAVVTDDLAAVLTDADYTGNAAATRGTVQVVDQRLTWTGDLAPTDSVSITYSVVIDNPDLGDKVLINRVTSDELGSTCPAGGSGSACTSVVTVLVPALDIDIVADQTTTTPGASVGYTLTIANNGQTDYLGARVDVALAGVLDDAAYGGAAVATTGSTSYDESVLTWTGNLAVGQTATITYSVAVNNPDLGNRALTTSVASTVPGSSCEPASPCVDEVQVLIPGLAISTTADVETATPGDLVTFTLTVANTGETPYVGTTVTTALGPILDDATVQSGFSATNGVVSIAASTLTWTGSLPVGASAVITYQVRIDDPDGGDQVLAASAVSPAAGSTCPTVGASPACTATVQVLIPGLSITKTADATTTTPGSRVVYTIVVTNTGETDYADAVISDSLAEVLPHAAYNDDAVAPSGDLAYDEPTLSWTGDLLVGATATITYSVTVDQVQSGDKLLINRVTSTEPGSTCPPGPISSACSVTVQVLTPALQVSKTADRSTVVAGSPVTYTVTLTNTGETDYAPATFTDPLAEVLDDATYANDATATAGTVDYANGTLAWTGALAQGATATITYSVTADYPVSGDRVLRNQVFSASAGATCPAGATDLACRSEVTVLEPALTIAKTADMSRVVAGGRVTYTVQATNSGQADYQAATLTDPLAGVLDDAVYDGNATASSGTVAYAAGILSWTGDLAVGENVLITYSVTTILDGAGDGSLVNQVSSATVGSTCLEAGSDPSCVSTVPIDAQVLTLSNLTPSFTLTGLPGATVTDEDAVSMTVTTNSPGGYVVSVQATDDVLTPAAEGNDDTIAVDQLRVKDSDQSVFTPLSSVTPFVVRNKTEPSGPGGDAVSNGYQIEIPFVGADTYSTTLDYVVVTQ